MLDGKGVTECGVDSSHVVLLHKDVAVANGKIFKCNSIWDAILRC